MTGYQTGSGNRLTSDGTYNYEHDNEGNLLTKTRISDGQVTENTWDHRNRLTRIVVKDAQGIILKEARYTYDVDDRRIGVWEDADGDGAGNPTQRWTAYDGPNPWADFDDDGSLTTRYLYGPAIDQLFVRLATGQEPEWYLGDYLGSVRQIAKTDGTVLDEITYDSFGQILNETNPENGDRFKYTAREWDALFGQYYYRARFYGPDVGRFISQDPINFEGRDTNLYRYGNNSPENNVDPEGLRWVDTGVKVKAERTGTRVSWVRRHWVDPTLGQNGYWRGGDYQPNPRGRLGLFDFSPPRHLRWLEGYRYRLDGNVQNLQVVGPWDDPPMRWAFASRPVNRILRGVVSCFRITMHPGGQDHGTFRGSAGSEQGTVLAEAAVAVAA